MQTDIIIIGAGPGGYETAVKAARQGLRVAIVEKTWLGGTCLNAGCIPTKCLCHSAEVQEIVERERAREGASLKTGAKEKAGEDPLQEAGPKGKAEEDPLLKTGQKENAEEEHLQEIASKGETIEGPVQAIPEEDFSEIEKRRLFSEAFHQALLRKESVVEQLREGIAQLLQTPGITLIRGEARFVDAHTVEVIKADGAETLSAPHIIIATGGVTRFLPIEGAQARGVITSDNIWTQPLPRRLCIVGGGVIGTEFASIFRSFGVEVKMVEFLKEILPNFDRDLVKRLRTALKRRGIGFHLGASVKAIHEASHDGGPIRVDFEEKGRLQSWECDAVLMAVGRRPNLDSLNLDDIGIAYTQQGITVDENMQTSVPGIYAIGDINGICPLAHVASFQGFCALQHITNSGRSDYRDALRVIPAAVFSNPEIAMVGATEEQLSAAGTAYQVRRSSYRANGKALTMEADEGMVKLLVSPEDRLLGAHILGAHASDLIHELALLMRSGGTVSDLAHTIHAHPSLSEIILAAAEG